MSMFTCCGCILFILSFSPLSKSSELKSLQQLSPGLPDRETSQYLLPKLAEKFSKFVPSIEDYNGNEDIGRDNLNGNNNWDEYVYDPKLFLLTEEEEVPNYVFDFRNKREASIGGFRDNWNHKGPSLSIVNPLDVLRQRLLLEIARRRQEKSQTQINNNREILKSIGKRNFNRNSFGAQNFDISEISPQFQSPFKRWNIQTSHLNRIN